MEDEKFRAILDKYTKGECTPEEIALLENGYLHWNEADKRAYSEAELTNAKELMWTKVHSEVGTGNTRSLWPRIAAAASIVLCLSVGYFFFHHQSAPVVAIHFKQDLAPGSNKAFLTLSSGKRISLTNAGKGQIASEAGVQVSKAGNGEIVYTSSGNSRTAASMAYNTIQTPRGGEYQVVLPDGSHVWLNASTTLKYPTSFNGNERRIELNGEAYFEVAHDKTKPFRVVSGSQIVEVLGTHFNIMAYPDEHSINTTLLEGSVKVSNGMVTHTIKPGQETLVAEGMVTRDADTEQVLAWKNGRTYFKDADIPTMMRTLGRWYNVDIEYRGEIPTRLFTGGISRKSNISGLLKILAISNIHTSIQDGKLIVSP